MAALQLDPATGGPIAYIGTLLLAFAFYSLTAHIAARFVLGDVAVRRAMAVGVVPAVLSLLMQQYGPGPVILVTLSADLVAIKYVYDLAYRTAVLVAVVHYTVSVFLGIGVFNLWRLLATAPT